MSEFLTRQELKDHFGGFQKKTIERALKANKVPYILGADEWPRVSRTYMEKRLAGEQPAPRYDDGPAWTKAA